MIRCCLSQSNFIAASTSKSFPENENMTEIDGTKLKKGAYDMMADIKFNTIGTLEVTEEATLMYHAEYLTGDT